MSRLFPAEHRSGQGLDAAGQLQRLQEREHPVEGQPGSLTELVGGKDAGSVKGLVDGRFLRREGGPVTSTQGKNRLNSSTLARIVRSRYITSVPMSL